MLTQLQVEYNHLWLSLFEGSQKKSPGGGWVGLANTLKTIRARYLKKQAKNPFDMLYEKYGCLAEKHLAVSLFRLPSTATVICTWKPTYSGYPPQQLTNAQIKSQEDSSKCRCERGENAQRTQAIFHGCCMCPHTALCVLRIQIRAWPHRGAAELYGWVHMCILLSRLWGKFFPLAVIFSK